MYNYIVILENEFGFKNWNWENIDLALTEELLCNLIDKYVLIRDNKIINNDYYRNFIYFKDLTNQEFEVINYILNKLKISNNRINTLKSNNLLSLSLNIIDIWSVKSKEYFLNSDYELDLYIKSNNILLYDFVQYYDSINNNYIQINHLLRVSLSNYLRYIFMINNAEFNYNYNNNNNNNNNNNKNKKSKLNRNIKIQLSDELFNIKEKLNDLEYMNIYTLISKIK